jgi:ABC-type phosphate/phosphonate transport system substrate-binding protein
LAGHSFAFGDTNSTVSLMVRVSLVRAGVHATNLTAFKMFEEFDLDALRIFSKVQAERGQTYGLPVPRSHREALRAVVNGKFDAGAGRRQDFERENRGRLVEVYSCDVPPDVYVARAGLDGEVVRACRDSLLSLQDKELLGNLPLQPLTQFCLASDADYEFLREALRNEALEFELAPNRMSP